MVIDSAVVVEVAVVEAAGAVEAVGVKALAAGKKVDNAAGRVADRKEDVRHKMGPETPFNSKPHITEALVIETYVHNASSQRH